MGTPPERAVRIDPKLRQRRVYVQERIPSIDKELKELLAERKVIEERFRLDPKDDSEEAKQLRRRRMFVKVRLQVLKDERQSLIMERRQFKEKFLSYASEEA
jgi:hypothetical protein